MFQNLVLGDTVNFVPDSNTVCLVTEVSVGVTEEAAAEIVI